ncbi:glycerophosphodiester phosphodiesterase family protein, partial [Orrella sp. 11846]|uniref:glycerophosphodiester phosphodiesterase family protein n=1 Tax=Orrella sp. 11846 TaxID=3409913 RepID=UPI003B5C02B2
MDPETATERANSYKSDHSRFIAHAGGELDGHRYTNSLEALDHSYRNGYRLFELDFIKTSDNHFVTSHDWILWRTQTGYEDSIPPTLAEFKKQKILGKYTGISMHDLNLWFVEHPDAILVSDKINEPKKFTAQFIAPDLD